MKCIITGCALIREDGQWVAGDLFDAGSVYVFNGNFDRQKATAKLINDAVCFSMRFAPLEYWERRGVFVIPKDQANLNSAALEYIRRWNE